MKMVLVVLAAGAWLAAAAAAPREFPGCAWSETRVERAAGRLRVVDAPIAQSQDETCGERLAVWERGAQRLHLFRAEKTSGPVEAPRKNDIISSLARENGRKRNRDRG